MALCIAGCKLAASQMRSSSCTAAHLLHTAAVLALHHHVRCTKLSSAGAQQVEVRSKTSFQSVHQDQSITSPLFPGTRRWRRGAPAAVLSTLQYPQVSPPHLPAEPRYPGTASSLEGPLEQDFQELLVYIGCILNLIWCDTGAQSENLNAAMLQASCDFG